jgi:hypothetical protein
LLRHVCTSLGVVEHGSITSDWELGSKLSGTEKGIFAPFRHDTNHVK